MNKLREANTQLVTHTLKQVKLPARGLVISELPALCNHPLLYFSCT